ncbi:hypothetical protein [Candidatus Liberibacter brunswickensis]
MVRNELNLKCIFCWNYSSSSFDMGSNANFVLSNTESISIIGH